jgi:hypothetical protein
LTDAYFYPASMVKLPAAVLALEKLNDLAVPGLTRDTALRIAAGTAAQTAVERDPSKADGLPSIAHYIEKIFLVSDNDAFNRLYEFLGQKDINERLWRHGFTDARMLRRLEAGSVPRRRAGGGTVPHPHLQQGGRGLRLPHRRRLRDGSTRGSSSSSLRSSR